MMRGYRLLKNNNNLDLLMQLRNVLTKTNLNVHTILTTSDNKQIDIELTTRQYLTSRILHLSFNKAILCSYGNNKTLRYPLPIVWQKQLIANHIKVNKVICTIYWFFYVLFLWCYGIFTAIKYTKNIITTYKKTDNYVYFDQLRVDSFSTEKKQYNITNWYLQWQNKAKNINTLCHGIKQAKFINRNDINIAYCDVMPDLFGINKVKYILLSLKQIILSLVFLLLGKTTAAVLLNQHIKFLLIKLANKENLAKDYLFHNSGLFYRPLWTYEAEVKDSRVIFYFYSTNDKNFKIKNRESVQHPWHLLTWPHYLVWNKAQLDYLIYNPKIIEEVGFIWFSCNGAEVPILPHNSIAVFDVQAVHSTFYIILGAHLEYYVPKIINQFLLDIQTVLLETKQQMAHKRKRTSKHTHKKYLHNLVKLKQKDNYIAINSDLSATTLIKQTKATISIPFTSTALIAKAEGKPSVYYDPSGIIQKDDMAAHGITVLVGIDELRQWVKTINNA